MLSQEQSIDILKEALRVAFLIAAPILGFGLVVGLLVSLFQAVTQINEATLTFVPKVIAMLGALVFFSPWMMDIMLTFTTNLFDQAALWSR